MEKTFISSSICDYWKLGESLLQLFDTFSVPFGAAVPAGFTLTLEPEKVEPEKGDVTDDSDVTELQSDPRGVTQILRELELNKTYLLKVSKGSILLDLAVLSQDDVRRLANADTQHLLETRLKELIEEKRQQQGKPTNDVSGMTLHVDKTQLKILEWFFNRREYYPHQNKTVYCYST